MNVQRGQLKQGSGTCNVTGEERDVPISGVEYPHTGMLVLNCDETSCEHEECMHNFNSRIRSKNGYLVKKDI